MKNSFLNNLIIFIVQSHSIAMSQPSIHIPNTVTSTRDHQNKPRFYSDHYSRPTEPGANRHARSGRLCSFVAAGLINMKKVTVPMSTHKMLVM